MQPIDTYPALGYSSPEALPMLHVSAVPPARHRAASPRQIRPGEEDNEDLKPKPFRIGEVMVRPIGPNRWQIRYTDPKSGRDVRRRLTGLAERELHGIAIHISREILEKGGYLPAGKVALPGVEDCLAEAIGLRNTRPETTKGRASRARHFVQWLAEHHSGVKTWDDLRPAMVQEYVLHLERRGLAYDTVRLCLAPIKLAWRHMADNYADRVRPLPRIRLTPAPRREIVCLDAREVAALLDWLKANRPSLWPMLVLQALCGLRLLEATALRVQDVDLGSRTLTVAHTPRHKPKTRDSHRTIPLPDEALQALTFALQSQKVCPATGEIFTNDVGNPWDRDTLKSRWQRTVRLAARETGFARLALVPPKRLRASFATMAGKLGVPDRLLKAFLGHSSGDVLGAHYRRIDLAELRLVSSTMNRWRELAEREVSGNIPATTAGI